MMVFVVCVYLCCYLYVIFYTLFIFVCIYLFLCFVFFFFFNFIFFFFYFFFFKQKTAYEIVMCLEFRRVLFRSLRRMKTGSMQVELRGAETVRPAVRPPDELGAQHIAVERVGALPFGNMHDAVVEADG